MKLSKEEYDYFNSLSQQEFYAVAKSNFERYASFIKNESKSNKRKRHKRFSIQSVKQFEMQMNCKHNCGICKNKCY